MNPAININWPNLKWTQTKTELTWNLLNLNLNWSDSKLETILKNDSFYKCSTNKRLNLKTFKMRTNKKLKNPKLQKQNLQKMECVLTTLVSLFILNFKYWNSLPTSPLKKHLKNATAYLDSSPSMYSSVTPKASAMYSRVRLR